MIIIGRSSLKLAYCILAMTCFHLRSDAGAVICADGLGVKDVDVVKGDSKPKPSLAAVVC